LPSQVVPGTSDGRSCKRAARFLEPVSKLPRDDHEAGHVNESQIVTDVMFPSDQYTAIVAQPGDGSFDDPAPLPANTDPLAGVTRPVGYPFS
jgi:hypothetical protein